VSGPPATVWRRACVTGGACAGLLAVVYLLAVWTPLGQRFEDAVLRAGGTIAGSTEQVRALDTLDSITVSSVIAAVILVLLIGLVRRRILLGFVGVGVIAASVVTAEVIQRSVSRPILLSHGYRREDQSFPSGHAAVAMSLMCALAMVVPYRFRGLVVCLAWVWAASVGVATVTASWHRPSDIIGADLIVACYACVAVAVLARWGMVREATPGTSAVRVVRGLLAAVYGAVAVLGFVLAAVAVGVVLHDPDHTASTGAGSAMLFAGRALALSGSAAVTVTLLALLRRVDLGAPSANEAVEGSPDGELRHDGVYRSSGP